MLNRNGNTVSCPDCGRSWHFMELLPTGPGDSCPSDDCPSSPTPICDEDGIVRFMKVPATLVFAWDPKKGPPDVLGLATSAAKKVLEPSLRARSPASDLLDYTVEGAHVFEVPDDGCSDLRKARHGRIKYQAGDHLKAVWVPDFGAHAPGKAQVAT